METAPKMFDERKNSSIDQASGRAEASNLVSSNESARGMAGAQSD